MQNPQRQKIILADAHEIVRRGIKLILNSQKDIDIVAEAASFHELSTLLQQEHFDILVLGLNFGDKNGISLVRNISDLYEDLMIIVFSMFPEDPYALQSIQAGASAYVCKSSLSDELLVALDLIKKNKIYLNPKYLDGLPLGIKLEKSKKSSIALLSVREFEVYSMIASGLSFKEIAQELGVSPKTVSTYRSRILSKLSLKTTTQLVHFALHDHLGI